MSEKHLFPCAIISFSFFRVNIIPSSPSEFLISFCLNAVVTAFLPLIFQNPFLNAHFCQIRSAVQAGLINSEIKSELICVPAERKPWCFQPFEWWGESTGRDPAVQTAGRRLAPVPLHFCSLSPRAVPATPAVSQDRGRAGSVAYTAATVWPPRAKVVPVCVLQAHEAVYDIGDGMSSQRCTIITEFFTPSRNALLTIKSHEIIDH